jgi:hypothetical protein
MSLECRFLKMVEKLVVDIDIDIHAVANALYNEFLNS